MLTGLAKLIQAVAHPDVCAIPPGEGWRHAGQTLMLKAYHHLRSLRTLADGVKIGVVLGNDSTTVYIDHGSMAALGRAAYEAYANFHFIFGEDTPEKQLFRWRIWKAYSIKSRLALNGFVVPDPRVIALREQDELSLPVLQEQIKNDPLFKALTKDEAGKTRNSNSGRLGRSLPTIVASAGIPLKFAEDMYNHYSEYAHSGAVSTWQIYDAMQDGSGPTLAGLTISFSIVLLNQAIISYVSEFPAAHAAFYADKELMEYVSLSQAFIDQILYAKYGRD